jgi:16S rRNA C1402 (ribose-2'-O) methylase RsmI
VEPRGEFVLVVAGKDSSLVKEEQKMEKQAGRKRNKELKMRETEGVEDLRVDQKTVK